MPAYKVVFNMPSWVAEGIATGIMEVVGGVVRRVDGKQIVMWLRPALGEAGRIGATVGPRLGLLAGGAALASAASGLCLVVSVVGFAMLSQQIGRIEGRLDQALDKLDEIKKDMAWLKRAVYLDHRAKLDAALHVADAMEATGNFDGLAAPLGDLYVVQSFFRQQLQDLLAEPCPLALAPAFVEIANLYVLATGAKARALTLLRGEAEAARQIGADAAVYSDLRQRLLAPLDDPDEGLGQFVLLTEEREAAVHESLPFLPAAAAAEYMPLPGLQRDPLALAEMRDASASRSGEPVAAVVVSAMAPPGWQPDMVGTVARP